MNPRQIRRVDLSPEVVSGIVFWSKNPRPMLPALDALSGYPYYIQFTLNGYNYDIEPSLPPPSERIDTLLTLSKKIGPERILWRYDPILLSSQYPEAFHAERFGRLAASLEGAVRHVTISFLNLYPRIKKRMDRVGVREASFSECWSLVESLYAIAASHNLAMVACAEAQDFSSIGIRSACCVDAALLSEISGKPLSAKRDPNQRPGCGCAASVDIGAYDTCPHGCAYCYANHGASASLVRLARHNPASPFLIP